MARAANINMGLMSIVDTYDSSVGPYIPGAGGSDASIFANGNIALVGACLPDGSTLDPLVRQVEVIVCSTLAAERVRQLADGTTQVIIDDRALDKQAIDTLAAIVIGQDAAGPTATPLPFRKASSGPPSRRKPPTPRAMRTSASRTGLR